MITYKKLFMLLKERHISKMELKRNTKMSSATLAKLSKDKEVSMKTIQSICEYLNCQPGDIMEQDNILNQDRAIAAAKDGAEYPGEKRKVVLIDTGLDDAFHSECIVGGITVIEKEGGFAIAEGYKDYIGHGTATADIILKHTKNVEIFIIRIYDRDIFISTEKLCFALEYVYNTISCDLIQISSGLPAYSYEMHQIIKKLVNEKNVCIISAFDNEGSMSYPAALEQVIGIDINPDYSKLQYFDYIEGDQIDFRGADVFFRTAWVNGTRFIARGTSFLVSYFTAQIANSVPKVWSKSGIVEEIKKEACFVLHKEIADEISASDFVGTIKKAIVFPFNKEIHSIAAFESLLPFEICGYYDVKHKFLTGKKVKDVIKYSDNEKVIENYEHINWSQDFDTVICGHVGEISKIIKKDLKSEINEKARRYRKKVYFFDDLRKDEPNYKNTNQIFCPIITENKDLLMHFGKLRVTNKPIVAIMGTSSKQGKFTIQLNLLKEFRERGIKADGVGSEPSSPFFGYSQMFPYGYGTTNPLESRSMIRIFNDMIWQVERTNPDLILVGGQSGTIPYDIRHESLLSASQYAFLLGVNPDAVVLCVNAIDELDYIDRTIRFLESASQAKVIAIVISRIRERNPVTELGKKLEVLETCTPELLQKSFGIPVYDLFDFTGSELADTILSYYQEE